MRKRRYILLITGILGILSAGAIFSLSYLTDSEGMTNDLSTGYVQISLLEERWDALPDKNGDGIPDAATDLHQGQVVVKDPSVVNESSIPIYAYLRVRVPTREVMRTDIAPARELTQLFSYDINNTWSLLASDTTKDGYYEYWYGCSTRLKPTEQTQTLFDSVTYANVVEGEIGSNETLLIQVDGFAMQAMGFSSMEEAWGEFDLSQKAMNENPDHKNRD